jgi:hypothetical protein
VLFELNDDIGGFVPVGDRFLMTLVNDNDAAPLRVITNWQPSAK